MENEGRYRFVLLVVLVAALRVIAIVPPESYKVKMKISRSALPSSGQLRELTLSFFQKFTNEAK